MGFDASLPDEVAPGEAAALRCKYWNGAIEARCKLIYDHPGIHLYELTNAAPKGSGGSSPLGSGMCRCGHPVWWHSESHAENCNKLRCGCAAFVPADAETAGAPEGSECSHEAWEERNPHPDSKGETKVSRWCNDCGEYLGRFAPTLPIDEVAEPIGPASVRRPPYAVAYVLEDGSAYEIALPGDATIRAHEGALVITHTQSPIKGPVQYRPMEGA